MVSTVFSKFALMFGSPAMVLHMFISQYFTNLDMRNGLLVFSNFKKDKTKENNWEQINQ